MPERYGCLNHVQCRIQVDTHTHTHSIYMWLWLLSPSVTKQSSSKAGFLEDLKPVPTSRFSLESVSLADVFRALTSVDVYSHYTDWSEASSLPDCPLLSPSCIVRACYGVPKGSPDSLGRYPVRHEESYPFLTVLFYSSVRSLSCDHLICPFSRFLEEVTPPLARVVNGHATKASNK